MTSIQVQAMQWAGIPQMGSPDLETFSNKDAACFKDIRDVLVKHGALKRFGMFLIHKHFDMAADEELMETTDDTGRELTIAPVKASAIDPENSIVTNWIFTEDENRAKGYCTCARSTTSHLGYHRKA